MIRCAAALCLLFAGSAGAEVLRFYGYAFDLRSDRHLYTEVHEQIVDGDRWVGGSITYYLPDGRRFGFKSLDFADDPFVPEFRLELPLEGYTEAIVDNGDPLVLERREGEGAKLERTTVARNGPTCADSGFHAFLRSSFDRLMAGETVKLQLVVAGSLDQFRFRARRIDDTTFEGEPAVRFRIEPASMLRFVVDPLELTYDPKERRLLEYRGVSNIRDPQTGAQYVTRIAYYSEPPKQIAALPPLQAEAECGASTFSC
ncbi:MAG: hypothetical protein AB1651_13275 [Pseudomonadota bacterium]